MKVNFSQLEALLSEDNVLTHHNHEITVARVTDAVQGLQLGKKVLQTVVTPGTLLLLSGGKTPKELYEALATEEILYPGAVGLVDERYGEKNHGESNEKMLADTGLFRYFQMRDIPFYPILQTRHFGAKRREAIGSSEILSSPMPARYRFAQATAGGPLQNDKKEFTRLQTADLYDEKLRELLAQFPKTVATVGIGLDGHTAGVPAEKFGNKEFETDDPNLFSLKNTRLVSSYNDSSGMYKERITMTFTGLSMIDLLIVLVFGDDKKEALEKVFSERSVEEIPGRFYTLPDIAKKTLFITDQNV